MPLSHASLAGALEDLFEGAGGYPAGESDAGRRWAEAYRGYAAKAVAGTTAPVQRRGASASGSNQPDR
jgi:hypothetical protein